MRAVADTITISSGDAMERLGACFAPHLVAGDCIGLKGALGAGKTVFARGVIAAALQDGDADIPSPSFTLVQHYPFPAKGDVHRAIWHVDLWRVGDASEIAELGMDEAFAHHICLIEWPQKISLPPQSLIIEITHKDDDTRRLDFFSDDDAWAARLLPVIRATNPLG